LDSAHDELDTLRFLVDARHCYHATAPRLIMYTSSFPEGWRAGGRVALCARRVGGAAAAAGRRRGAGGGVGGRAQVNPRQQSRSLGRVLKKYSNSRNILTAVAGRADAGSRLALICRLARPPRGCYSKCRDGPQTDAAGRVPRLATRIALRLRLARPTRGCYFKCRDGPQTDAAGRVPRLATRLALICRLARPTRGCYFNCRLTP